MEEHFKQIFAVLLNFFFTGIYIQLCRYPVDCLFDTVRISNGFHPVSLKLFYLRAVFDSIGLEIFRCNCLYILSAQVEKFINLGIQIEEISVSVFVTIVDNRR